MKPMHRKLLVVVSGIVITGLLVLSFHFLGSSRLSISRLKPNELIGTWKYTCFDSQINAIAAVTFYPDGSFSQTVDCKGLPAHSSRGTWAIDDQGVNLDHLWVREAVWRFGNETWYRTRSVSAANRTVLRGGMYPDPDSYGDILYLGQ
jgi:hypothetical protein